MVRVLFSFPLIAAALLCLSTALPLSRQYVPPVFGVPDASAPLEAKDLAPVDKDLEPMPSYAPMYPEEEDGPMVSAAPLLPEGWPVMPTDLPLFNPNMVF